VAPRGLTHAAVVEAATRIADADGLDAVTIAAVAAALGVKPPSLYNHVASRDALLQDIGAADLEALAAAMARGAAGVARDDALLALARTMREYALAHPGAYLASARARPDADERYQAAAAAVLDVVLTALRGYGLAGDAAIHAARTFRATVHGFVALEAAAGFAMPVDLDASFTWALRTLATGLAASASSDQSPTGGGTRPPAP
jgi:AcrR family transcriptional regulator